MRNMLAAEASHSQLDAEWLTDLPLLILGNPANDLSADAGASESSVRFSG